MMTKTTHLLCITSLFLSFLLLSPCTVHGKGIEEIEETENEREFSYVKEGGKGPDQWGKIHPEWGTCDNGEMQSPIDLLSTRVETMDDLGKLHMNYKETPAGVMNRGHDIMVKWHGDAGSIKIDGTEYFLKQCHWHSPAEHTFNGTRNKMELHMVHETPDGKIAVIAATYKYGKPDDFLNKIIPHITEVGADEKDIGMIDPAEIELDSKKYYRYIGSLTVPPCTEGVVWTVIKKVGTVSKEQVEALKEAVHDGFEENARPIQHLKGRTVSASGSKTS